MSLISRLTGFVRTHETAVVLALAALTLLLVIFNLCLFLKLGRLWSSRKRALAMGDKLLPEHVEELARRLDGLEYRAGILGEHQKTLYERLARTVQKVGLVRFDAFADVGGEQSFALALLDEEMNGVVLSSLYGRTESRAYAKEVTAGQSQHALSDEEVEALRRAGAT